MKLYRFIEPVDPHIARATDKRYLSVESIDYRFARALRLGTWASKHDTACPECGASRETRVPPLVIEWQAGADEIGDFVWPGLDDDVVVSQRVREAFEASFPHSQYCPVQMYQHPKLKRPERPTKRTKPRVWLPYDGPALWDLQPTSWCGLDRDRSGMRLERVCTTCGREFYAWNAPLEERYLVVDPSTWNGDGIFRIREFTPYVHCTEAVRELVKARGFTNAGFLPVGEIPE